MSEFSFAEDDFIDIDATILKAAENQTSHDTTGKPTALKTTASESAPRSTLTVVGISDAAMGSQAFMPEGAVTDIYNRVGQDVMAQGIGENGGPQTVMGGAMPIAPNDLILKAELVDPIYTLPLGGEGGAAGPNVGTGTLNLSEYPPRPDGYRGTSEMRRIYAIDGGTQPPPQGSPQYITQFKWWDGRTYSVHKATVPVWALVDAIMKKYNYGPGMDTGDGGAGQVVRRITGGSGWSLHSYGIAVDINPAQNPYSRTFQSDMPPGMIQEILSIRTAGGLRAIRWGGHYTTNKDAMHFEVVVRPDEIAAGPLSLGGPSSTTVRPGR